MIGWAPRYLARDLAAAMVPVPDYAANVVRVNPEPAPWSQRVLIEMRGSWNGHEPMSGDDSSRWQPDASLGQAGPDRLIAGVPDACRKSPLQGRWERRGHGFVAFAIKLTGPDPWLAWFDGLVWGCVLSGAVESGSGLSLSVGGVVAQGTPGADEPVDPPARSGHAVVQTADREAPACAAFEPPPAACLRADAGETGVGEGLAGTREAAVGEG